METPMETLQYPTGRFTWPQVVTEEEIHDAIQRIAAFPDQIRKTVKDLEVGQLDTPYRPQGWTIRQVVHHCADSHMNAYMRFKLALTEDNPTIKSYDQTRWATLLDSQMLPPEVSLSLIDGVHARWVKIMENMSDKDWNRTFHHPEYNITQALRQTVMMYRWHCGHHLAHITNLLERLRA